MKNNGTMKRIKLLLIMLMLPLLAVAKPGYKFTLQIDNNRDTMMLLGYYYAESLRILDTAYNNGHGKYVFEGDRELLPGLYFFNNQKGQYVDFVVYHEKPNFKFHTDQRDWQRNMEVKGSKQNTVFFNFHRASEKIYEEMENAKGEMDDSSYGAYRRRQYLRLDSIRLAFVESNPDAMVSRMMMATKDPAAPPDSLQGNDRYFWFMHHYFDNMPLDDDFLVRTPKSVFYQRVADYIDKHMHGLPPADIIPLLDSLMDRAEPSPEVFKWLVHTTTEKFLQSNVMVYDEVYVHMVQRYYATGKAFWMSPTGIDHEVERATKWERLLVGREAPELILFDTLHRPASLHHMPGRYTLLLFWSPTCGHCREIIPAIYKVFDRVADSLNITAFAILSEPDEGTVVKWKKFLADHHMTNPRWINLNGAEANVDWREVYDIQTTPQIYLVENETHKFVAKKLSAELFETICKQLK